MRSLSDGSDGGDSELRFTIRRLTLVKENTVSLPFPKRQILDTSKLKEFADDNTEFKEMERNFSKRVENTVGKGEIARFEQFLLFLQCFQKGSTTDT